jgi:transcription elongation factor Elf1
MHNLEDNMNFNHLMETKFTKRRCRTNNSVCYFVPVGNIRSTQGENVHMMMLCKNCGLREDIFLTKEEYQIQRQLIQKEIGHA